MHIHEAYTKLIAWLETPEGKSALACTLILARRGMDKDQAKDKTEQLLRDLKTDRLFQRDLRLVAACVFDNLLSFGIFLASLELATAARDALVSEAGGLSRIPHETRLWDSADLARFKQRNPARATA